jgi:hypothetical protein
MIEIRDVSVVGGPARVSIELDFGPQGIRGSQIFAGVGNPNEIEIGQTPIFNDLYVDLSTKIFYQYQSIFTAQEWVPLLNLESNEIAVNIEVSFDDGVGEIALDMSKFLNVLILQNLSEEKISCNFSINNIYPCSSSILSKGFSENIFYLDIVANEFDGTSWQNLSGQYFVDLLINFASDLFEDDDIYDSFES